ncbi:CDP-alcohol phosphatidyltransferase [Eggerthellaceae bacterium zg-887]|uniref:CDP-alcohol phosphatidyltransferase n=1 Tax=Xiamenia xianingshaonis TaxID=2682776 RepID=UPI00140E5C73|nr:CDP-alcohol phosphatidyltransferase [Xiamenia xianingshaonis]NHM15438.1 CDP-alcohol phosphatidyltransferase [Xiamenia xianingshaonis]
MGRKAVEELDINAEELSTYLHAKHSVYMDYKGASYYITDANDQYWRAQDATQLNEKGHYIDASELVPTLSEFLTLPFLDGASVMDVFPEATFYASVKDEA